MICPWRIERRASVNMPYEFYDVFCRCHEEDCPCYEKIGDESWCYRDDGRFPLNPIARMGEQNINPMDAVQVPKMPICKNWGKDRTE